MINKIWLFLLTVGIGYSLVNNNVDLVNDIIYTSTPNILTSMFSYFANMIFFSGILEVVRNNGMLDYFSNKIRFLTRFLFKDLDGDSMAIKYISGNIAANILGMGSAATPFGLKAMKELNKGNDGNKATKEMITLILVNTSGLTLIPTGIIVLRSAYQATFLNEIIIYIMISTTFTTLCAILIDKAFKKVLNE